MPTSTSPEMPPGEARECIDEFVTTMANLNKIAEEQTEGIARIAIEIAEAVVGLSSGTVSGNGKTVAQASEELAAQVEQLKSASGNSIPESVASQASPEPPVEDQDAFCHQVGSVLLQAMENAVYNQQQTFVTAQAMVTMGAAQLFAKASGVNESHEDAK